MRHAHRRLTLLAAFAALSAACSGGAPAEDVPELRSLDLTWTMEAVGEGIKPAFALDSTGAAHVAFLTEADHGSLFYATNASGTFVVETVAEGYFYGPVDLALGPAGEPYIAYHDHQDLEVQRELGDEVVAILRDGGWELVIVKDGGHDGWDNSIVVDADGHWHTAAVDPAQFRSQEGVEYATDSGGTLRVEAVGSGPVDYEFGTSIGLAPDGSPGIAYYDSEEDQLEYASLGPDGWSVEIVDADGDAGRYASLAFDPQGNPHIAYFTASSSTAGLVRHAWRDGSAWQVETVDTLDDILMGSVGARKITALVIDSAGGLHLAYTDRGRIVYAVREDGGWAAGEVTSAGERPLGQLVELALDSEGNPHLVWFQPTSFSPELIGTVIYAVGSEG